MRGGVVAGMSGGVDSSVAAALLVEQGFEVLGVSLNLVSCDRVTRRTCCAPKDRQDARDVCRQLGIKHHVVDCRLDFKNAVIAPFVEEYFSGRTPSPCILCNERVKFSALIGEADRIGAQYIATGHYARVASEGSKFRLFRAADVRKDQSYFLFRMRQDGLARTLFPLGSTNKTIVRKIAVKLGLSIHSKEESQEICFVPDRDCAAFVEEHSGRNVQGSGNFVDMDGQILGRHRGIHAYTIGQRRGLGLSRGSRQYVVRIDRVRNEVVLGRYDDLMRREMFVGDVSWVCDPLPDGAKVLVKIRSSHTGEGAKIELAGTSLRLVFAKPVYAIAPGQAAVFYKGDEVLGGGWIV